MELHVGQSATHGGPFCSLNHKRSPWVENNSIKIITNFYKSSTLLPRESLNITKGLQ